MNLEKPYLAIVFCLLLFLGVGNLWDHRLSHDFPFGYLASDTFQQQTRAEGIMDAGSYRYEPSYIVKGYSDVVGYYPSVLHHLGILLHYASGVPLYDTVYFIVFLAALGAVFAMYLIIRSVSRQAAIVALPLSLLLFSNKSYTGFLWGHWAAIVGQMFLICIAWALLRQDMEKSWILLGIFMGALALSHTSELLYGVVLVTLFGLYLLLTKQLTRRFVIGVMYAAAISTALAFYNLLIFIQSFQVINPYTFSVSKDWGGTPIFLITDFGILLIVMAVGIVAGLLMFRKAALPVLFGLLMLGIGYTNYIGFGIRAFQPRLFWPVYFMFFFGMGIYFLLRFIPEKMRALSGFGVAGVFLLIFSGSLTVPLVPAYNEVKSPGLMDVWHWDAFQWISKNTPPDSNIYFFYGDIYNQDALLRNSKRTHGQVVPEELIALIQNQSIKREFWTEMPADHGAGMPYWDSFLKIKLHMREDREDIVHQPIQDICRFDYFVFDKASRQEAFAQYNILIANEMIGKGASVAFQNDLIVILRNNAKGGDCIEERTF